jgi:ABC-type proline/glycine betaine transport system permease subunit
MSAHGSFVARAEQTLIAAMALGIVMIAQRYQISWYRWGLSILVISTFLQIAVGNLPQDASATRSIVTSIIILAVVAAVFAIGIWLVPILSQLGH